MNNWLRRKIVAWLAPALEERERQRRERDYDGFLRRVTPENGDARSPFFSFVPEFKVDRRDRPSPNGPEDPEGQAV